MNGFILAAGLGTRFRPVTLTTPKPLIPVVGKPAIEYSLEIMQSLGITEVVINTFHLAQKVRRAIGNGSRWGLRIHYSHEEELLGTAGGFVKGQTLFSKPDTTIILSADIITNVDIQSVVNFHQEKRSMFTVGVLERENVTGSGILLFNDDNLVTRFAEKPTTAKEIFSHWVNGSIYVVEPAILPLLPKPGTFADFAHDLFPQMIENNAQFYACPLTAERDYLIGIDSPILLKQAETDILNSKVFYEK